MNDDSKIKPLLEWNRLARENAENAIVSSMFEASLKASEPIEIFSTWLLISTAAIASFLIVNTEKLIPFITKSGFVWCGVFLCLSCIFGLISKLFAIRCKIGIETGSAVKKTFNEHLDKYNDEEQKIQAGADFWGIKVDSGIRIDRVLEEFFTLVPSWARWLAKRHIKKNEKKAQIAHLMQMSSLNVQGVTALFQAICFLGFLCCGFFFAATNQNLLNPSEQIIFTSAPPPAPKSAPPTQPKQSSHALAMLAARA
jgi:hypothetical protein